MAIIGVLASVVLASLNSAREKGKAAAIKSNLKNMIPEAELAYDTAGNYSTAYTAVTKMLTAINSAGATSAFYSHTTTGDVYQRWGASGIIGTSTPIKAWSASGGGAVTWDTQGVDTLGAFVGVDATMSWVTAGSACVISGGRLPTAEELETLSDATYIASGNTTRIPPGFGSGGYWSSTAIPPTGANAYAVNVSSGGIYSVDKTLNYRVRCVR